MCKRNLFFPRCNIPCGELSCWIIWYSADYSRRILRSVPPGHSWSLLSSVSLHAQLEPILSRNGTRHPALSSLQYGALCRNGTCSFCQKMFHILLPQSCSLKLVCQGVGQASLAKGLSDDQWGWDQKGWCNDKSPSGPAWLGVNACSLNLCADDLAITAWSTLLKSEKES